MTTVTLPDFVENIEEGYISIGDHFIDASSILSMRKDSETTRLGIRFVNGYTDLEGQEAIEFINKFNRFILS